MSTTTTNYGLIKPDTTDPILIGQLNDNSDAIDAALKENADAIENKPDAADIPSPSTAAPAMDGTAAAGTSTDYARADHVHPSDTSKASATAVAKDRAALVELVDSGAKNLSGWDGGAAATDSSFVVQNEPITLKKATYAISFDTTANSGRCEIVFRDSNGVVGSYTFDNTSSSTLSAEITLTADAVKFNIFTTKAATITNFMICTKAAWDISHEYQPYRPSYQELYEMVKALQPTQ